MTLWGLARVYRIEEVWGEFARIAEPGDLIQVPEKTAAEDGLPDTDKVWEIHQDRGGFVAIPDPAGRFSIVPVSEEDEEDDDGRN